MQIVGYDTGAGATEEAALLLGVGGELQREPLTSGRELSFGLGNRRCAGALRGANHVRCDAPDAPYCETHDVTWVCARCTGTCLKAEMDCYQEHAIYLAAFAPATFKVGVTKSARLPVRLREQGADRGARIRTVENGRIAREIEAEIAAETPIPDRIRTETKVEGMGRSVDESAWERLLSEFPPEERFDIDYELELPSAPIAETLASGTVRGTKGRLLVLDRDGDNYAVDLRELVGYELTDDRSSRRLQSTLGSF